jgi:hypothetical protein
MGLAALGAVALTAGPSAANEPARPAVTDPITAAAAKYIRDAYPPADRPADRPCYDPKAPLRSLERKALESCLSEGAFRAAGRFGWF